MLPDKLLTIFTISFIFGVSLFSVIMLSLSGADNKVKNDFSLTMFIVIVIVLSCYIVYMIYS